MCFKYLRMCAVHAKCFSHVQLSVKLWTVAHRAPLSMGFSRQEYWSGLYVLLQGVFPIQVSNLHIFCLLHCQVCSLPYLGSTQEAPYIYVCVCVCVCVCVYTQYVNPRPGGSDGKESSCNAGDLGLIPGLGRSPGVGYGNPLQYSCLENPWTEEHDGLQSMGSPRVRHD